MSEGMSATTRILYSYLPQISDEFARHAVTVMNNGMAGFLRLTSTTIPRDTGDMARNITTKKAAIGEYEASVTYNQEYAPYVHGGTSRQSAQPWAENAVRVMEPDYINQMMAIRLPSGS